ncbi:hypothetical protein GQ457_01G011400 [Hibiscus cannabinus]
MTGSGSDVFQRFLDKWRYNNGSSDPILGVFKPFKADNHELKLNLEIKLKNCNPMFFIWFKSFVQGKDCNSDQEQVERKKLQNLIIRKQKVLLKSCERTIISCTKQNKEPRN